MESLEIRVGDVVRAAYGKKKSMVVVGLGPDNIATCNIMYTNTGEVYMNPIVTDIWRIIEAEALKPPILLY